MARENSKRTGKLIAIQDSLVNARFQGDVVMGETAQIFVDGQSLQAEVLSISPDPDNADAGIVEMQVFEDLTGAKIGDLVEFTGESPLGTSWAGIAHQHLGWAAESPL